MVQDDISFGIINTNSEFHKFSNFFNKIFSIHIDIDRINSVELHQKLTILGILLLAITFIIQTQHEQDQASGFNFAYISGIAMLILFSLSFILFNKDKLKDSKK